ARDLIAKIAAAVPERLRPFVFEPAAATPPGHSFAPDGWTSTVHARGSMQVAR
ncbi:MAG: hypothetical protein JWR77_1966, partial [Rhizorhabdus sp.]|nr:hypothetical protein [Rhizorhabdus sp.]